MQPAQLQAQATQNAQQGQNLYNQDVANQAQYKGQYEQYQGQANAANQQLQSYTDYMRNAGSGTNLYNTGKQQAFQEQGFDPQSLAAATQNLIRSQNAMGQLQQASQSSTGGYGLSGAQLGNFYSSQSQPLSNQIQAQNTAVGGLQQLYQNALTNANQYAGAGLQGEQVTEKGLQDTFTQAANQRDSAMQQMQFYGDLAQKQGGMNAQMAQSYAQALQAYQQAQQAIAQAGLLAAQARNVNLDSESRQRQLDAALHPPTPGMATPNASQPGSNASPNINFSSPGWGGVVGNTLGAIAAPFTGGASPLIGSAIGSQVAPQMANLGRRGVADIKSLGRFF